MNPESAYWSISTWAQVVAAVLGLLFISGFFYLSELKRHLDSTRSIRKRISARAYSAYRLSLAFLIIFSIIWMLYVVYDGFITISDAINVMSGIDSGAEMLSEEMRIEVEQMLAEFETLLVKVFIALLTWFTGIILVYFLDLQIQSRAERGHPLIE